MHSGRDGGRRSCDLLRENVALIRTQDVGLFEASAQASAGQDGATTAQLVDVASACGDDIVAFVGVWVAPERNHGPQDFCGGLDELGPNEKEEEQDKDGRT